MGNPLLETLILATGLPETDVRRELQTLMAKHGKAADTVTLEDLREILAEYLQDVLVGAKESASERVHT